MVFMIQPQLELESSSLALTANGEAVVNAVAVLVSQVELWATWLTTF
ncbi:hypothetical protein ACJJIW_10000 [Microbulbifer sp. JMSA004]